MDESGSPLGVFEFKQPVLGELRTAELQRAADQQLNRRAGGERGDELSHD